MKPGRIREILGVWAPMAVGLFIIVTAINFYFTAPLGEGPLGEDLEAWRLVCSAGALFVGGVLILSTYGRYTKTKEARREATETPASTSSSAPVPDEDSHDDRDGREGDDENR